VLKVIITTIFWCSFLASCNNNRYLILFDIIWYYLIIFDIIWYYLVLFGIVWYSDISCKEFRMLLIIMYIFCMLLLMTRWNLRY
jgi:hypothetical protein